MRKILTPNDILTRILDKPEEYPKDYTYLICGKHGATGKTWLWNELTQRGYNAVDVNESLGWCIAINSRYETNCYEVDHYRKCVIIALNRYRPWSEIKKGE